MSCEVTVDVFLVHGCSYISHIVLDAARDAYLVSTLTDMQSKLDCIMRVISRMLADSIPANPDLPDDIVLPVANSHDLEAVEQALANNTAVNDSTVSYVT